MVQRNASDGLRGIDLSPVADRMLPRKISGPRHDSNVKCRTDARETIATRFNGDSESKSFLVSTEMGTSRISFQLGLKGFSSSMTSSAWLTTLPVTRSGPVTNEARMIQWFNLGEFRCGSLGPPLATEEKALTLENTPATAKRFSTDFIIGTVVQMEEFPRYVDLRGFWNFLEAQRVRDQYGT